MAMNSQPTLIVYCVPLAVVAFGIALLYFLLHKGQKKKRIISAGCMLLCIAYLVWFYLPYRYPSDPENVRQFEVISEHGISYDPEHVCVILEPRDGPNWLEITEEEARQIVTLSNDLIFRRSILHVPGGTSLQPEVEGHYSAPENEFITLRISRPHSDYLVVTCALGEKGFAYYEGTYCVEQPYGRVYGWEPLVAYIRELAVKYGIELPVW